MNYKIYNFNLFKKQKSLATIVMMTMMVLFINITKSNAQEKSISGIVLDESNNPVSFALVAVKGTTKAINTDLEGKFKLNVEPNATLVFTSLGYIRLEIVVEGQDFIKALLKPSLVSLKEVAVIGYGTVKKSDATGSVSVISSKDFNKGAITSVQELVVGKSPGVVITSNSGAPGNTSTIRIRGGSSLSASNDPLIVIDGMPISNVQIGGASNILSTINPNDVESMTILKDASATAIYGSRASNGVIEMVTKRGGAGFKVNYSMGSSLSVLPKQVNVLTGDEYRALVNQQYPGQTAITSLLGKYNTDWQSEIYQNAFSQDHNLNVSGTVKKLPYRFSLGYNNSDGILKTYNFNRTTLALAVDPSFFKEHLKIKINAKEMYNTNNFADQGAIGSAVSYDPTKPVKNGNTAWRGYTTWTTDINNPNGSAINLANANPVAQINLTDNASTVTRFLGNTQIDYKFHFLPDLHANLNLGYDITNSDGHNNVGNKTQWIYNPEVAGGQINPYSNKSTNALLDFYLNYTKPLEKLKSKIELLSGYSWSHFYRSEEDSTMNGAQTMVAQSRRFETEYYLVSFFGRMNYTFNEKYFFTATLREDGTSRFSPENRWGLFPAAALAWKINKESFLKDYAKVTDLKLRLGYGITGQQNLNTGSQYEDYAYLSVYTLSDKTSQYKLGDTYYNTLRPDGYDANIKWEESATFNVGLDYGFFDNRINGSIDYYNRKTTNLISSVPPAAGTNFTGSILTNIGATNNNGLEFSIVGHVISKKDLTWEVGYNIALITNEITKLNLNDNPEFFVPNKSSNVGGTTGGLIQAQKVGNPVNSFYVYKQVYDAAGKPIEDKFEDLNGDGVINNKDLYMYHNPAPAVTMGISSKVNYKKWSLSLSGRLNLGNYVYNNVAANSTYNVYSSLGYLYNTTTFANDTKFLQGGESRFSDYYVRNASFFRMDNINVGYQFSNFYKDKIRLYLSAGVQNVFVVTKYTGLDPEVSGGLDNNFFPRSRTFVFGLNCGF